MGRMKILSHVQSVESHHNSLLLALPFPGKTVCLIHTHQQAGTSWIAPSVGNTLAADTSVGGTSAHGSRNDGTLAGGASAGDIRTVDGTLVGGALAGDIRTVDGTLVGGALAGDALAGSALADGASSAADILHVHMKPLHEAFFLPFPLR